MDLLLVEDEVRFAAPLLTGLRREGFDVTHVASGREALEATTPDVVLLDLGLPDMDGLEVARELRSCSTVPIIITTARKAEVDMVLGLELGADDYIMKPFSVRQLTARIRAVTRRVQLADAEGTARQVEAGGLTIDVAGHVVSVRGTEVHLTPREFDLLVVLARRPGVLIDRQDIIQRVWGEGWVGTAKTIDAHIAALRKKLGSPEWIQAVRGRGFKLRPQV